MTSCSGGPAEDLAVHYLAGELTELESEEFENHYIGCDTCHTTVMTLQSVKSALADEPIALPQFVAVPRPDEPSQKRVLPFPVRIPVRIPVRLAAFGSFGSIAALLVAAMFIGVVLKRNGGTLASNSTTVGSGESMSKQEPKLEETADHGNQVQLAQLASIADLKLPGYRPSELRGAEATNSPAARAHAAFLSGMKKYAANDCIGAVSVLNTVPLKAEDGISASLYSGLCQMRVRKLKEAQASFARVTAAGDTPQLETAEYFLAQTALLAGDASSAQKWLNRTIALRGDYEERARNEHSILSTQARKP